MRTAARYSLAVLTTAVAIVLTVAFPELLAPMRLFFLWCAVLTTAVVAGTGPGLLATALALVGAVLFVFPPYESTMLANPLDVLRLALFALFAGGLSIVGGRIRELAERLRADIDERKRHEESAAFINRASELLASSLSSEEAMRTLARLCVPALGDWCAIHLGHDEHYQRLVAEHSDPERMALLQKFGAIQRPPPEQDVIVRVLTTGKSLLVESMSEEMLEKTMPREHYEIVSQLGLHSWIVAPMIAHGRTLGALTVVCGDTSRRYSEADVPLIEDLARRAAMALDNARLYEAAEAANRTKDEFLATLSHELRTPLTAISGWAHMLSIGIADDDTKRLAIETIVRSARTQGELIDDLLDLSRVVAGTLHLQVEAVDLQQIVEEVLLAAKPAADAKDVTLTLNGSAQAIVVRGDERRLRQIVWNLVTNAVKFTKNGGRVELTVAAQGAMAGVEVKDTGRGIDPAFLPYVWDRFRQADSSTSRQYGGLGLGLAVVRHLAEMHGGTVHAESDGLGRGATFRVEIPMAREGDGADVPELSRVRPGNST
jgi:signal transduction histidine kinase